MKLFCLAHAGGSANVFLSWRRHLDPSLELVPVELSGRGRRIAAPLAHTFPEVLEDALAETTRLGVPEAYALAGHSFGALVAYELASTLTSRGRPPRGLLVSGCCAPTAVGKLVVPLPGDDRALLTSFAYLGGTPEEILADEEAVALFAPVLRADLQALFDYRHRPRPPLPCDLALLLATADAIASPEDEAEWAVLVSGEVSTEVLPGGHFAPFDSPARAGAWASEVLLRN